MDNAMKLDLIESLIADYYEWTNHNDPADRNLGRAEELIEVISSIISFEAYTVTEADA